jgi:hypothetical protein
MGASPAASIRYQTIALFLALFAIYNSNGRETGSGDTQPAKFTAASIATDGTLVLDSIIQQRPGLAERAAFARDRAGHWRSAYPIVPALIASIPASVLHGLGLVDMNAPLAPNLIAVLTASALTAGAVSLVFVSLTGFTSRRAAWLTTIALGLGTNYWPVVSRTIGAHETVAFGLAVALWSWWRPAPPSVVRATCGAFGLALAGAARPQIAPLVIAFLAAVAARHGVRALVWPCAIVAAVAGAEITRNVAWFGHPLGATAHLESLHPAVHAVPGVMAEHPLENAAGLLFSPSRGILLFSPIVAFAAAGAFRRRQEPGVVWLGAGVVIQFCAYAAYSVWWAGHSFGPRYLTDVLVPLAPLLASGVAWVTAGPIGKWLFAAALAWSMTVAALGAFVYPNDRWNNEPSDVDRHHERLWDWGDSQIRRAWMAPWSPQNFDLLDAGALRVVIPRQEVSAPRTARLPGR